MKTKQASHFVSFVGADDQAMGQTIGPHLIQALGGNSGNQGRVALIEGPAAAPTSRDRGLGFHRAIAAHPGISLLGSAPGRYLQAGGREAMAALLAVGASADRRRDLHQ